VTVTTSTESGGASASLRERKKQATRRQLRWVALALFAERGFSNVTVEEIAEAAEVSPRTFFNYFPSKEAVLPGADPERMLELRQRILTEAGSTALEVLRAAMIGQAREAAAELADLSGDPGEWLGRMKAARADVHLRAAQAAHMAAIERSVAEALAQRLAADVDHDPYPALLAAVAAAVFRSCLASWAGSGGIVPLEQLVSLAFGAIAEGLPETTPLRRVIVDAARKEDL